MCHKIKNGAIFIADAHENDRRDKLYSFLQKIESKQIATSQLFLMGDMFDLLIGHIKYSQNKWQKYIDLIDKIALHVEVFYLEGNHDFQLSYVFKNINIIPIKQQPAHFILEDKTDIYLSHGDKYSGDFLYIVYTKLIRSSVVLKILNFIDTRKENFISKKIENDQHKKSICTKIKNFEDIVRKKIVHFKVRKGSFIVEGHYHQNHSFVVNGYNYINLPSFACNQSYFIVECYQHDKFTSKLL